MALQPLAVKLAAKRQAFDRALRSAETFFIDAFKVAKRGKIPIADAVKQMKQEGYVPALPPPDLAVQKSRLSSFTSLFCGRLKAKAAP